MAGSKIPVIGPLGPVHAPPACGVPFKLLNKGTEPPVVHTVKVPSDPASAGATESTTLPALVALQPLEVTVTEYVPAVLTVRLWAVLPPGLHTLPVALLLVNTMLLPAQKLDAPLIVGVEGKGVEVTTLPALVALQPLDVTVTEYVPAVLTVRLWAVLPPGLQTLPVALLLVNTMLLPAQKLDGPVIVGVAGAAFSVTTTVALELPQGGAAFTVYVYVPGAIVAGS